MSDKSQYKFPEHKGGITVNNEWKFCHTKEAVDATSTVITSFNHELPETFEYLYHSFMQFLDRFLKRKNLKSTAVRHSSRMT